MRVITVARKPLSESSVAANVLKHGTGAINVDACRIGVETRTYKGMGNRPGNEDHGSGSGILWMSKTPTTKTRRENARGDLEYTVTGRWPANMVLQHRPGCQRVGTRKVRKGGGDGTASRDGEHQAGGFSTSHYGPDGSETVDAWHCEPGCPAAALDRQTGDLAPQGGPKQKDTGDTAWFGGGDADSTFYGDAGGASRFFKQVGGEGDAD